VTQQWPHRLEELVLRLCLPILQAGDCVTLEDLAKPDTERVWGNADALRQFGQAQPLPGLGLVGIGGRVLRVDTGKHMVIFMLDQLIGDRLAIEQMRHGAELARYAHFLTQPASGGAAGFLALAGMAAAGIGP
jgi:hypothetical protein